MPLRILVIAHPDDESMFFVPTIRAFQEAYPDDPFWILCLTKGDYDGLGRVRVKELEQVAKRVLRMDRLIQLDELQDHPTQEWSIPEASKLLHRILEALVPSGQQAVELITFDHGGVSGHINHRDTYLAVRPLEYPVYTLSTETNPLRKYLPVLDWFLCLWTWFQSSPRTTTLETTRHGSIVCRCHEPSLVWKAMQTHASQFVWYRRLFVVFSVYSYRNVLKPSSSH